MLNIRVHSLLDFCRIRVAYMMWARRYVAKNCPKEILFNECLEAVLSDVQSLQIPEECKPALLKLVEPTGKHLLSLLSLWIFAEPENSQQWLTGDTLCECLIVDENGLINQRKTAQKIISSRMIDNVVAFRLTCINFLEIEVLKLWTTVKKIFLNKLLLECSQPSPLLKCDRYNHLSLDWQNYFNIREYAYSEAIRPYFLNSTEREEVFYWISYCLSKENGLSITDIPHFLVNDFDWYEFSLEFATFSGNVACFDYFQNFCDPRLEYEPVHIIKNIFYSHDREEMDHLCFDRQLPCFIFHYMLLDSVEQEELFRNFPSHMLFFFLQWPLSLTFLDNIERLWDLVKDSVLKDMFELFSKNFLRLPVSDKLFNMPSFSKITGIYSSGDLIQIWDASWNRSSESLKSEFLNSVVFVEIQYRPTEEEFKLNFEPSGLKEKLNQLFLSNGEAILELYEKESLQESLRNLVTKYMPEHYDDLNRKCISYLRNSTKLGNRDSKMEELNTFEKRNSGPIHRNFLDYLKNYCFSFYENK